MPKSVSDTLLRLRTCKVNNAESMFYDNAMRVKGMIHFLEEIKHGTSRLNSVFGMSPNKKITDADREFVQDQADVLRKSKITSEEYVAFKIVECPIGVEKPPMLDGNGTADTRWSNTETIHIVWHITDKGEKLLATLKKAIKRLQLINFATFEVDFECMETTINNILDSGEIEYDIIEIVLENSFPTNDALRRKVIMDKLTRTPFRVNVSQGVASWIRA